MSKSKKLGTSNIEISSGSNAKVFGPGQLTFKVLKLELQEYTYIDDAYHLVMIVEGEPEGSNFQGFYYDMADKSKGKYKGLAGRIKFSYYAYANAITKSNIEINRDQEILKAIKLLCLAIGDSASNWFSMQDNVHESIESFVSQFNEDVVGGNEYLIATVCGREYINKEGYLNYDLFLPKRSNKYEILINKETGNVNKLESFSEKTHIFKVKIKAKDEHNAEDVDVDEFSAPNSDDLDNI